MRKICLNSLSPLSVYVENSCFSIRRLNHYCIKKENDESVIFEGMFSSLKECIEEAVFMEVDLICSNLSDQTFRGASLRRAQLHGSMLSRADFREANLRDSSLKYARLDNVLFDRSNLKGAQLNGADTQGAQFVEANLTDVRFAGCNGLAGCHGREANFKKAKLYRANFQRSILDRPSFVDANLKDADFREANLAYVDFTGASLKGAVFYTAAKHICKFSSKQLKQARFM